MLYVLLLNLRNSTGCNIMMMEIKSRGIIDRLALNLLLDMHIIYNISICACNGAVVRVYTIYVYMYTLYSAACPCPIYRKASRKNCDFPLYIRDIACARHKV